MVSEEEHLVSLHVLRVMHMCANDRRVELGLYCSRSKLDQRKLLWFCLLKAKTCVKKKKFYEERCILSNLFVGVDLKVGTQRFQWGKSKNL